MAETREEELETEVENFKKILEEIEGHIDDAKMSFEQALQNGYESVERYMDEGFAQLDSAKNMI